MATVCSDWSAASLAYSSPRRTGYVVSPRVRAASDAAARSLAPTPLDPSATSLYIVNPRRDDETGRRFPSASAEPLARCDHLEGRGPSC